MKKFFSILVLILTVTGCASIAQNSSTQVEKSDPTSYETTITATIIHPTLTQTIVPVNVTPYSTVIPSEIAQFIDKLVSMDEVCSFPCWAGVVPGKTNWSDIYAFLASFAQVSKHSPLSPDGYAIYIPLSNRYPDDLLWLSIYLDKNSVVKYINGWRYNSPIDLILKKYGKPEQVYLFVLGVLPSDSTEQIRIVLSYKSQGFLILYEGETRNQANLEICSSNFKENSYFWLWSPQDSEAMATIVNGGSSYRFPGKWQNYQEITGATSNNITVDLFYETYSDPASLDACFQVPSMNIP
jgi:hypothetical protein